MATVPRPRSRHVAIVTWTRRHRLVAFFGLTFAPVVVVVAVLRARPGPTAFFPCGPLVAALIVIGITEGRAGYRDLGARMIRWRVGWRGGWSPWALPLAVLAVAAAANVAIWGAPAPGAGHMAWSQPRARRRGPVRQSARRSAGRGARLARLRAPAAAAPRGRRWRPASSWPDRRPVAPAAGRGRAARRRRPIDHLRDHAGLRLAVQPHRRQRPADHGVPRRRRAPSPRRRSGSPVRTPPRMDWLTGALWLPVAPSVVVVLDPGRGGSAPRSRERPVRPGGAGRTLERRSVGSLRCLPTRPHLRGLESAASRTGRRRACLARLTAGAMADEHGLGPLSRASSRAGRRFAVPERHLAFWIADVGRGHRGRVGRAGRRSCFGPAVPIEPVQIVFRLVGGSFAACGLVAWHRRPDSHSGRLMTATGFAFFCRAVLAQLDSPFAQTAAQLLPDLWMLFFVPLLLTFLTGGRLRTRMDKVLVGAVLLEIVVLAPLYLAFAETRGPPAARHPGRRDRRGRRQGAAGALPRHLGRHAGGHRRAVAPRRRGRAGGRCCPSVAGAVCLLLFAALLLVDLAGAAASAGAAVDRGLLAGRRAGRVPRRPAAVPVGQGRARRPVRPAADDAARPTAGRTGAGCWATRRSIIAYPVPDGGSSSTSTARPVEASRAASGRSSRRGCRRDGVPVAALVYDRSLDDDPELVEAVGGAVTIALENRRLHAEADDRLAELQSSRERIITASDAERRRIERNLHDGAQQRLVTLGPAALADPAADPRGSRRRRAAGAGASDELAQSLAELRELARGIHPGGLEQGLESALEALALRSAVPSRWTIEPGPRLPEAGRVRGLLRRVGGAGQRGQVRRARRRRVRRHRGDDRALSSRSPTTVSAEPRPGWDRVCAGSRTGWRHSAAGSRCRARRAAARSSPPSCRRPDGRPYRNAQSRVQERETRVQERKTRATSSRTSREVWRSGTQEFLR